jgi:hypothetical protein
MVFAPQKSRVNLAVEQDKERRSAQKRHNTPKAATAIPTTSSHRCQDWKPRMGFSF